MEDDIIIHIGGIIAILFKRDGGGNPIEAALGVVEGVPNHELTIKGEKTDLQGVKTQFTVDPSVADLQLVVTGTTQTGIRFFNEQMIDRIGPIKFPDSSSWILDFEGTELYGREIGAEESSFRTIFRINNGVIFTEEISRNHLLTLNEGDSQEPPTLLGRVATLVGIGLDLDLEGSKAQLMANGQPVAEVLHGEELEMSVFLTCDTENGPQPTGHANHYYRALGTKLKFGERKLFSATKMPAPGGLGGPISPEASCLVGQAGQSNPGG